MVVLLVCLMVWWCYSGVTCVPHGMVVLFVGLMVWKLRVL